MEVKKTTNPGVSIIICCFNSQNRIQQTLSHLAQQIIDPLINWEVILIDNNSTDLTATYAQNLWLSFDTNQPLIIDEEENIGLAYARKKGIETARYDTLIICDDDNWLNPQYIQIAFELMQSNSEIGVIGGWGVPEWEVCPPDWLLNYSGCYATGPQGLKSGEVSLTQHVYGAGTVIRKAVIDQLNKIGFEGLLTGRKGKAMLAGEDHELCYAVYLLGYKIWYDERLEFRHFIPKERMQASYLKKLLKGFALCGPLLTLYKIRINCTSLKQFKVKSSIILLTINRIRHLLRSIMIFRPKMFSKPERFLWIYYRLYGYYAFILQIKKVNECRNYILTIWPYEKK